MAGSVEAGGGAPQRRAYERMTADHFCDGVLTSG